MKISGLKSWMYVYCVSVSLMFCYPGEFLVFVVLVKNIIDCIFRRSVYNDFLISCLLSLLLFVKLFFHSLNLSWCITYVGFFTFSAVAFTIILIPVFF